MAVWATSETITAAKLNQKELYVGSAAPGTTYAGMLWLDTDDNKLYQRNAANLAWLERPGLSLTQTVTGLWTFDRGASAPFAVAAGAKVTNLDADKVDGVNIPGTLAQLLSDHNKAAHDALNINADTVDTKHAGLGDGQVAVLPTATVGKILRRGVSAWEAATIKYGALTVGYAWTAGDSHPTNAGRMYVAFMVPTGSEGLKPQIRDGSSVWYDLYTEGGTLIQAAVADRWYRLNVPGSSTELRFYKAGGSSLYLAYYQLEAS